MKKKALILSLTSILIFLLVLYLVTIDKDDKHLVEDTLVLRYAENQPTDYPTVIAAQYFADLVKKRTDGRIIIKVLANAQLGDEKTIIEQLVFGGIEMARVSLSPLSEYVPEMNLLQLPYLYDDRDHFWAVLDSELGSYFLDTCNKQGMIGLSWYDAGARSFYTTSKITSLEDMQGLTIRIQESELMEKLVKALGASGVKTNFKDVYQALQTGIIDGAENNWPSFESTGHYTVAKYLLLDEHTRVPEVQIVSSIIWEKLSFEDQSIIKQAALESSFYERQLWQEKEKASENKVRLSGIEVVYLDNDMKESFRKATQSLYEPYEQNYADILKQIQDYGKN